MNKDFQSPFLKKRRAEFYILILCLQRIRVELPMELKMLLFNALRQMSKRELMFDGAEMMKLIYGEELTLAERIVWEEFTKDDWDNCY